MRKPCGGGDLGKDGMILISIVRIALWFDVHGIVREKSMAV